MINTLFTLVIFNLVYFMEIGSLETVPLFYQRGPSKQTHPPSGVTVQFVEDCVVAVLEHEVQLPFTAKHLDQIDQVGVFQLLQTQKTNITGTIRHSEESVNIVHYQANTLTSIALFLKLVTSNISFIDRCEVCSVVRVPARLIKHRVQPNKSVNRWS